ncbi:type II toxin-antitoxin system VapC family toxin [Nocardia sp. NBC_01503]|uniref:type II toxin-antitoxin system VapC family toxin n=1 Tax=Nocardia sp. NBC_01503 TaxID=2975997 RepID=UPI002E7B2468|nr:type II toxin-antitoxin system VapC family toxin [Nocardia sp. NBC_01503]WTL29963.1 type II toxin-antitoxin system VapC family toxin [Nocardia sp. NBC_01503]
MIILDTNVISALMTPEKAPDVAEWVSSLDEFCTTAITTQEVTQGIMPLPEGKRKRALLAVADAVFAPLHDAGRVLPYDYRAAVCYAHLMEKRPVPGVSEIFDAQISAIALLHSATVATRQVKDFQGRGFAVFDPWTRKTH